MIAPKRQMEKKTALVEIARVSSGMLKAPKARNTEAKERDIFLPRSPINLKVKWKMTAEKTAVRHKTSQNMSAKTSTNVFHVEACLGMCMKSWADCW